MHLTETTFPALYDSAVRAFPRTTRRQHATGPVRIEALRWVPYLGVKTLFVRATAANEDRRYGPLVVFKRVNYRGAGATVVASDDGRAYHFDPLRLAETDVLVRCDCPDFRYRFAYYNSLDRSLQGGPPAPYESQGGPPANPRRLPGACKHLMAMMSHLTEMGVVTG